MVLASSPVMSIVEPHQGLNYPGWGSRSLLILVDGSSLRPSLANAANSMGRSLHWVVGLVRSTNVQVVCILCACLVPTINKT